MIINGQLVDDLIVSSDSPLLYGDGITESLRTYSGEPFGIKCHLDRMERSARKLDFAEVNVAEIEFGIQRLIEMEPREPFGRLRIVYLSDGTWFASHSSYLPDLRRLKLDWSQQYRQTSGLLTGVKSLAYGEVRAEGRLRPGIDDFVYLNTSNEVVETGFGNIALYRDGEWITPSLRSGCLPGITRQFLIENFGFLERSVSREELEAAEEVIVTSAVRKIASVQELGGIFFPSSKKAELLRGSFESWILGNLAS